MNWLKDIIVDILVTIFIATAYWLGDPWMWWVITVYTVLLLIAKGVVLTGDGFMQRAQQSLKAPEWFLHLLYLINIILLGVAGWWFLMSGWCLIWLFSYLAEKK